MDRRNEIQEVVDQVVSILAREYEPQQIVLYGSCAGGETDEASDIDLLIVKESSHSPYKRAVEVRRLLRDPHRRIPIELLIVTPEELQHRLEIGDQFMEEILSRGRVLYVR